VAFNGIVPVFTYDPDSAFVAYELLNRHFALIETATLIEYLEPLHEHRGPAFAALIDNYNRICLEAG